MVFSEELSPNLALVLLLTDSRVVSTGLDVCRILTTPSLAVFHHVQTW